MRKTLLTLSLSLMLGAGSLAAISAATAQPAAPQRPLQLAQAAGPQNQGRRFAPNPEQRAERRAQMCQNALARAAGRLAQLEVLLDLTAGQRTGFNRWRDVRMAAATRRADTCPTAPVGRGGRGPVQQQANAQPPAPPSPVERMARQEQQLRQRLADLTAERPALEALYNSLTPEQRQKFARLTGGPGRGMGRGGRQGRMTMMMRDRMGGGPRDGARGGPGRPGPMGPGMAPPPPPPQ